MRKTARKTSLEAVVFYTFLKIMVLKSSKNLGVSEKKNYLCSQMFYII